MQHAALLKHGGQPPPWAEDFSAPLNPLGPPYTIADLLGECVKASVYTRYPSPDYRGLREAIAAFHGVDAGEVVVVNGAAEALTLIPAMLRARRLIVIEPSYGDHGVQARLWGVELRRVLVDPGTGSWLGQDVFHSLLVDHGIVLLTRPNNPVGYLVAPDIIYELAEKLSRRDSMLVVDEAFIDLAPGAEPLGLTDGLIVVRSFTKAFALPGIRLGYIYAEASLASRLRLMLQPWPVSSISSCVYSKLLSTTSVKNYLERARSLIAEEAPRIRSALSSMGLVAYPTSAPFILVRHRGLTHPGFQEELARRGVYVRDASSFYGLGPDYSRVSVRTPGHNDLLLKVFKMVVEEQWGLLQGLQPSRASSPS